MKRKDVNQIAHALVEETAKKDKNPHAQALGRLGGKVGGKVRAERLTPERKKEIAQNAAKARWSRENS